MNPSERKLLEMLARMTALVGVTEGLAPGPYDSDDAASIYHEARLTLAMHSEATS